MLREIAVIKANFISHPTLDKFIFPSPWCLTYGKCRKWGFPWKCPQSGTKDAMPEEILHLSTYFWLTKVTCMEERLALSYFLSSETFWDGGQGLNIMWAVCTYNSGRKRKWKTTLSLWRRVHKMKNLQGLRSTFCQMIACRCTFWHVCCSEWLHSVLVVDFKKDTHYILFQLHHSATLKTQQICPAGCPAASFNLSACMRHSEIFTSFAGKTNRCQNNQQTKLTHFRNTYK